jgi:hypothetical protein
VLGRRSLSWRQLAVMTQELRVVTGRISAYSVCGAWRGNWVVCRFVGDYRYLSRRDEVVGVLVVGSRGRLGSLAGTPRVKAPRDNALRDNGFSDNALRVKGLVRR